jgi:putative ABC transport system permease protein
MLKFFWLTITRHKAYTFINILGLSLGITACLVIYLICSYELSFDRFHPDRERIYRIGAKVLENAGNRFATEAYNEDIPPPAAAALQKEIPGLDSIAAYYPYPANLTAPKKLSNTTTILTGPDYFSIFHYDWLAGHPANLNTPFSIVLTANQAQQYFGSLSPEQYLGKQLCYDDSLRLHVIGIVKDWSQSTDFPYTGFISFSTINASSLKNSFHPDIWRVGNGNPWIRAFVKLRSPAVATRIEAQFPDFITRHMGSDPLIRLVHFNLTLQPLSDIHFNEAYIHDDIRKANLPTLYALMGTALFILLLAVVNFINLATAQSIQRQKEIGIRKVLGSSKTRLGLRILAETAIFAILATLLALLLVQPILSIFHSYIPDGVRFNFQQQPSLFLFITAIIVTTTLLAGLYPARLVAAYAPALNLKKQVENTGSGQLRKSLIVFQFTVSLLFIIGSIIMQAQIHFMRNADTGLATDAVVTIYNWNSPPKQMRLLAEKLKELPAVKDYTLETHAPLGDAVMEFSIGYEDTKLMVSLHAADERYIPFYQLQLLAGHNFRHTDSLGELVINETYCQALGFKDPGKAIGKFLSWNGRSYPIAGVVKDFHDASFHQAIRPIIIGHVPDIESNMGIRLATAGKNTGAVGVALQQVQQQWKMLFPDKPLDYRFLDESIEQLYQRDRQSAWLINAAMVVTIFISCIGLLGLFLFITERRKKEISIRKVLGASVADITLLLNKEFVQLIGLSLLIASPLAWWAAHRWLETFAWRVTISWWTFVLAGLCALGIAVLTVSVQVIRAALAPPAQNLRSE